MKFIAALFVSIFILTLASCSSETEKKKEEKVIPKEETPVFETFPTGQIIDKVACEVDSGLSYSMYLPKAYDTKKAFPVIYAFDPHKTGKLPVANYKELAEKYGYIIIGSNNLENGLSWDQSQAIANTLLGDTRKRLSINTNRIYLLGFSGGARIANALTMTNSTINGVICCGAASPAINTMEPRNDYTFFGIAGNADFNYTEMKKYHLLDLAGRKLKHNFITFDGKHEWPPVETMEEAFLWLELNNMRRDSSAKKDSLITHNLNEESEKLGALIKGNKEYEAYEQCRKVINYYEQLGDLSTFFAGYNMFKTKPGIDKQLKKNEADLVKEEKLKQEYTNNLQTQELSWWQNEIASMNRQIRSEKNKNEVLIKKRLLSYLSLVCYMQTNGALKQNNLAAAEHFGKIYVLVDPENTEAHYLMAVINAKNENSMAAFHSLSQAIQHGFSDKKRIENDDAFSGLRKEQEFGKILQRIK
jgi:hypothetical protein